MSAANVDYRQSAPRIYDIHREQAAVGGVQEALSLKPSRMPLAPFPDPLITRARGVVIAGLGGSAGYGTVGSVRLGVI